jgi:hypothetical protein
LTQGDETISFDIHADGGAVGIRLDEGSVTALPRAAPPEGEATELTAQPLLPDVIEDQAGHRLDESGQLFPVTADQIGPGDLVVQPVDDGVDIVRADGSQTEIRPISSDRDQDGSGGSYSVIDIGPTGEVTLLEPDAEGMVHLNEGITVQLPTPQSSLSLWEQAADTEWKWIVLGYTALALVSIALALHLRSDRPEAPGVEPGEQGQAPADRFEELMARLAADPDPARAIRLAFGVAERGMGSLPARLQAETPFEWYARVTADRPELDRPLSTLCSEFATARFAPDRPTASDRDLVVDELRLLAGLAGPGSAVPTDGPTTQPRISAP